MWYLCGMAYCNMWYLSLVFLSIDSSQQAFELLFKILVEIQKFCLKNKKYLKEAMR